VEYEMHRLTYNHWGHGIVTKGLKECENNTKRELNRFSTENSCTRGITHNKKSATVWNLKPEWWGAPLVQEKYQHDDDDDDDIPSNGACRTGTLTNSRQHNYVAIHGINISNWRH